MNPTAGGTSSKFQKEKSVAIPAENGIFCRFRSRPQMSQKSSYDNKGTIKMTVYIHVTLTSDLGYKTFLNSSHYYTTAVIVTRNYYYITAVIFTDLSIASLHQY